MNQVSSSPAFAMVTPSYAADFDRCRLLVKSVRKHVRFPLRHYIVVEQVDLSLFQPLAGPDTIVMTSEELLGNRLQHIPGTTRKWKTKYTGPISGWIYQQLVKITFALQALEDVLIFVDSDVLFLRPFDSSHFVRDGKIHLRLMENYFNETFDAWYKFAYEIFHLKDFKPGLPRPNYVGNLITWKPEIARSMCAYIEEKNGKPWIEVLAPTNHLSEYTLYGLYVQHILADKTEHFVDHPVMCRNYWGTSEMNDAELKAFIDGIKEEEFTFMISSKAGIDVSRYEHLLSDYLE